VELFEATSRCSRGEELAVWQVVSRGLRSSRGNRAVGRRPWRFIAFTSRSRNLPANTSRASSLSSFDSAHPAAMPGAEGQDQ
jgi:hypothetical protein